MALHDDHNGDRPADILEQAAPAFLQLLDSDPEQGFAEFYRLARALLTVSPPRVMWQVPADKREDQIHDIILHCCRDDFRVLRRYQDRGKAFAAWFMLVARNKILDHLRSKDSDSGVPLAEEDSENPGVVLRDGTPLADAQTEQRQIIELVREALQMMSDKCRILIEGAAEGYRPRELTKLLGWPADQNKKASDDLRECRKRLRRLLGEQGLDPEQLRGWAGSSVAPEMTS